MTTTTAPQPHVKLKFNDRDYEFADLPRPAQMLLQDMMQLDQQIGRLQFELRHLQTARKVYGASLRKTMAEEEHGEEAEWGDGHGSEAG